MDCTSKECFSKAENRFSAEKINRAFVAQIMKEWRAYEYAVEQTLKHSEKQEKF